VSVVNIAGLALSPLPGVERMTGPPFNIIISTFPVPAHGGTGTAPGCRASPRVHPGRRAGADITATSYADSMEFGLVGCRRNVPSLQRLLIYLEDSLAELEKTTS